ncbi:hypothetical protein JHK84_027827 [Glycine max]|uniref:65-kDa microtubule-associated protein 8 n=1 Tax=Glycine soja TaxID=3848 RepID=A0A0B2RSB0_GLYSO|nr:hypothetical protein JHK86_027705 [Glycine max]KAG5151355.1 hypothetical protein JHK84_027827 [Glycine max]KHN35238.1 65-kDa microtubule-associated protein 8 [Glycine soja]
MRSRILTRGYNDGGNQFVVTLICRSNKSGKSYSRNSPAGEIDHSDLLLSMDEQISRAKEEASSRKAIMEKWVLACDEE